MFPLSNLIKIDANILFGHNENYVRVYKANLFPWNILHVDWEKTKQTKDENYLKQAYKFYCELEFRMIPTP